MEAFLDSARHQQKPYSFPEKFLSRRNLSVLPLQGMNLQTRSNAQPEQFDANLRENLYCESTRGQANEFLILFCLTPRCQIESRQMRSSSSFSLKKNFVFLFFLVSIDSNNKHESTTNDYHKRLHLQQQERVLFSG